MKVKKYILGKTTEIYKYSVGIWGAVVWEWEERMYIKYYVDAQTNKIIW